VISLAGGPEVMRGELRLVVYWLTFVLAIALVRNAIAAAPDLKPPQVTVNYIFPPSPLLQDHRVRLYYEMIITDYIPLEYQLQSIEADAGPKRFIFNGDTLKGMTRAAGQPGDASQSLRLGGGGTVVVFVALEFDHPWEVPAVIRNTLHMRSPDGTDHELAINPLTVKPDSPLVVAPPLRGPGWIAGDSANNNPDAAHRRAVLFDHGNAYIAQRYAIDWVKYQLVNGVAQTWSGPENKNSSYFCYDAPIYSMTAGRVVEVMDGVPENVPHSGKVAIDVNFANAAGNHVVVDIGYSLYALYAHMRPGTIKVKKGEIVKAGDVLGHIGNTGNSTEPHLHEHIDNQPSFLAGQGVPYEFDYYEASGANNLINGPHDRMTITQAGELTTFTNDYPAANAAVTFRN
jgi:hypothetical protein